MVRSKRHCTKDVSVVKIFFFLLFFLPVFVALNSNVLSSLLEKMLSCRISKETHLKRLDEGLQAPAGFAEMSINGVLLWKEEEKLSLSLPSSPDPHDRHAVWVDGGPPGSARLHCFPLLKKDCSKLALPHRERVCALPRATIQQGQISS